MSGSPPSSNATSPPDAATPTAHRSPTIATEHPHSIKRRITLTNLALFLLAIWLLSLLAGHLLGQNLRQLLQSQQEQRAALLVANLDAAIERRLEALQRVARHLPAQLQRGPAAAQTYLDALPLLQHQFNAGAHFVPPDQSDDHGLEPGTQDNAYTIGHPRHDVRLKAPVLTLSIAVRDSNGKFLGALVGHTHLAQHNFLHQISAAQLGAAPHYMLIDRQTGTPVAAPLTTTPAPITPQQILQYANKPAASTLITLTQGNEFLLTTLPTRLAPWQLAVLLPSAELFAPIQQLYYQLFFATLALSLLATALCWWIVHHQLSASLAPLEALPRLVDAEGQLQLTPVPVQRHDEIGTLLHGFNQLLQTLHERDTALQASNTLLKEAQQISHVGSWTYEFPDGPLVWSDEMYRLLELEPGRDQASVENFYACVEADDRDIIRNTCQHNQADQPPADVVIRLRMCDGRLKWVRARCSMDYDTDGQAIRSVGTLQDISAQRITQEALQHAKQQLDSIISNIPAMVFLKRATDLRFELINRAGEDLLGFKASDLLGKNDHDLFPAAQADFFILQDRHALSSGQLVEIPEEEIRTASGATRYLHTRKVALRNSRGEATHLLGIAVDITEHKQAAERINQLAFYDQLTGLPNRTLLYDRLRQCLASCARHGNHAALLFIDLDKFKTLNDSLGHDQGDRLLQQVAERLRRHTRSLDTVARLGGDEFVVLLAELSHDGHEAATHCEHVGTKLLAELGEPYELGSVIHHSSASIGATLILPDSREIDSLFKQADLAMYKAKAAGRNVLRFFDPQLETDMQLRASLERDLYSALQDGHFVLYYQAQYSHGRLAGSEALVRWQHPQRGLIAPDAFIPLAEDTGLILPLGNWVLEAACQQLARWADQPQLAGLTIAVNVSAQQFRHPGFVSQVTNTLQRSGARPERLKIELTESLLVEDVEDIISKMTALKQLGVSFALDDFGTGYSSLYYLKRLPLEQMKIDRSFVRDVLDDPNDAAIARTIVALAHSLGLSVVAEGVETEAQRRFLQDIDCHSYQGYLYSQPLAASQFEHYACQH